MKSYLIKKFKSFLNCKNCKLKIFTKIEGKRSEWKSLNEAFEDLYIRNKLSLSELNILRVFEASLS